MSIKKFIGTNLLLALLTIVGAASMTSCKDDIGPAIAEIQVVDSVGNAVAGANITLVCSSSTNPPKPCDVEVKGTASESGKFRKEFDHPSVLRIVASSIVSETTILGVLPDTTIVITNDSICGEAFITIKEDETNRKTVVLYGCN